MLQTQVTSETLPEIEVKATAGQLAKLAENKDVNTAFQTILFHFADLVAERVLAKLNGTISVPEVKTELPATIPQPTTVVKTVAPKVKSITPSGKRTVSEEVKRKISESQKARWANAPHRGLTDEAKQKIAASQHARWAKQREGTPSAPPKAMAASATSDDSTSTEADCQPQHSDSLNIQAEQTPATVAAAVNGASLVTKEGYSGDPIYQLPDGHYVGQDGFVVPQSFMEFYERYPNYIKNWVKKRLHGNAPEEDIEDWSQDLIIHMKYLPLTSKHRLDGKEDVVQTFNPFQQYGASERRFRYYINMCLTNKFNTVHGKRVKNPVCRKGNLSLSQSADDPMYEGGSVSGEVSDEYIFANSKHLSDAAERAEKNLEDKLTTQKFLLYVEEHDATVVEVLKALHITGSTSDILNGFCNTCGRMTTTLELQEGVHEGHDLGMSQQDFQRAKNRLKQLAECFVDGVVPPKTRKVYKKRDITGKTSIENEQ